MALHVEQGIRKMRAMMGRFIMEIKSRKCDMKIQSLTKVGLPIGG